MKIKLQTQKGIEVLSVTGPISDHEGKVLNAGITKLLTSGKNRVIIHFIDIPKISSDLIREIGHFEITARELSGKISVSGVSKSQKTQIDSFYKPSLFDCFEKLEEAISKFNQPHIQRNQEGYSLLTQPSPEKLDKEQILQKELNDFAPLRERISNLEGQNNALKEQLIVLINERDNPPSEQAYLDKIKILETKLKQYIKDPV